MDEQIEEEKKHDQHTPAESTQKDRTGERRDGEPFKKDSTEA
jgi:hypothetical protein